MDQRRDPIAAPNTETGSFAARFGHLLASDGVAVIPSALYYHQGALRLEAQEVWLVAAVLARKWATELPQISRRRLAAESGLQVNVIHGWAGRLIEKELLVVRRARTPGGGNAPSAWDFSPLFSRLENQLQLMGSPANPIRGADTLPPLRNQDPSFLARYGTTILAAGIASIPRALFTYQGRLGLSMQEVWFISYLLTFYWGGAWPYPSLRRMAARTGYATGTLHDYKDRLVQRGVLRVVQRYDPQGKQENSAYDLSGLLRALEECLPPADGQTTPPPDGYSLDARQYRRRGQHRTPFVGPLPANPPKGAEVLSNGTPGDGIQQNTGGWYPTEHRGMVSNRTPVVSNRVLGRYASSRPLTGWPPVCYGKGISYHPNSPEAPPYDNRVRRFLLMDLGPRGRSLPTARPLFPPPRSRACLRR